MMRFAAITPETQAAEQGGDCLEKCYDAYHRDFRLTADWKLYSIRWSELLQSGWGAPVKFSKHIMFYGFGLAAGNADMTTPYDYWVDDVTYFIGAPPTAPAVDGGADGGESGSDALGDVADEPPADASVE